jgi:hypothetical protein
MQKYEHAKTNWKQLANKWDNRLRKTFSTNIMFLCSILIFY